ncbi:MAG: ATPase [Clostridiales bacterium]|nr:ATPase [Clostridiales bacterium]
MNQVKSFLGIELGSTRIKAVLTDERGATLASGGHNWENRFENGVWTYHMEDVRHGIRQGFAQLVADYAAKHEGAFPDIGCMGVSAMMHGYLPLDGGGNQLAEFRTWRNTITEESAARLSDAFGFNIPQRWSIAHLHRAIIGGEAHVGEIALLTTLAGYVHYRLTGQKVLGVGDASGVFPIDSATKDYDAKMAAQFDDMAREFGFSQNILDILPKVLQAGEFAGNLTEEGAALLDPSGGLAAGIPLCPPEGDAGTGMVATNSISAGTGNVSAGTSVFAMLVLERGLSRLYPEIDVVTTPAGLPVAMVHCNNCSSDLDAWVGIFGRAMELGGARPDTSELYRLLYEAALSGEDDAGGLTSVNYLSGEHITGFHKGRPLFVRTPESKFTLENYMRSLLFSAIATLRIGMDILASGEGVQLDKLLGHGGYFKTEKVGQKLMAGALNIPVAVMESAGEGGAWGIAVLAAYAAAKAPGETLEEYLQNKVFVDAAISTIMPCPADVRGFNAYLRRYKALLNVERAAVEIDLD